MWIPASTAGSPSVTDGRHTSYALTGMTCVGCANAVTKHLAGRRGSDRRPGRRASGTVTISSSASLDTADVRAAVEHAGHQLVG